MLLYVAAAAAAVSSIVITRLQYHPGLKKIIKRSPFYWLITPMFIIFIENYDT